MTTPQIIEDGDVFQSSAQTLVNTVNCVGVMGKGIALGFKRRFPEMFDDYVARCERGEVRLGRPYLYRYEGGPLDPQLPDQGSLEISLSTARHRDGPRLPSRPL